MSTTRTCDEIRSLIDADLGDLVAIRHDLHRHPELMYEERRTAEVVRRELDRLGVEYKADLAGGTGVLAHLPASDGNDGPATALRADMDALPIPEETGREYASTTPGVMHACGHDGHTTILLGAIRALQKMDRPHAVTFVFQPAEEGGAGGDRMCRDGVLEGATGRGLGPKVGRIFGLHGWPQLPLGTVGTKPGPLLAATDEFDVTIVGRQGHAAYPHLSKDAIVCAASIIQGLQTIASRTVSPLDSVVCTVGAIHAGEAHNVIPERVTLRGTIRTLLDETRTVARERFFEIVRSIATAHACVTEIDWNDGYPVTSNDEALTDHFFDIARGTLPDESVVLVPEPGMGGEDFSYYGQHVPACFFLLGLLNDGDDPMRVPQLHQPTFDFNDKAIPLGVEMMCRLAIS